MAAKNRKDADPRYTWDLTQIYPSKEEFEKALSEAEAEIGEVAALSGKLTGSAGELKAGLDRFYALSEKLERAYCYAMLHSSTDNGEPEYQDMESRAMRLFVAFSAATSFLAPRILALPEDVLNGYVDAPELKKYRHFLDDIRRGRAHTLDEGREELLARMSEVARVPSDAFNMFESVDMKFPDVKNSAGEALPMSHGAYGMYLESSDRTLRKNAYEAMFGEFKKYENTFAALYAGQVKTDVFVSDTRGFGSACEAALFGSNVPTEVYDRLIDAVHGGLPAMKKYLGLKKRALGVDELEMYDLYASVVPEVDFSVPFEDSKKYVLGAVAPLGEEYRSLIERAYAEKWMDVYENAGKTTGAYSLGVYGVHPFVLLNYTDTLDDVYTVAHELGHSMHSYFSNREQDFANHDYHILVAEVASTVNEVLLTRHLLETETDPKRRAYVLGRYLEGFRTTVFRQTLFAEFEKLAHEAFQNGQTLNAEALCKLYRDLNLLYYDGANVCDLHGIEWARIPHFYRSFYVYQYATGFSSAVAIADSILSTGDPSPYLKFLTLGGSDYPIEELKVAGVDLTSPRPVADAMAEFARRVDELEQLM